MQDLDPVTQAANLNTPSSNAAADSCESDMFRDHPSNFHFTAKQFVSGVSEVYVVAPTLECL